MWCTLISEEGNVCFALWFGCSISQQVGLSILLKDTSVGSKKKKKNTPTKNMTLLSTRKLCSLIEYMDGTINTWTEGTEIKLFYTGIPFFPFNKARLTNNITIDQLVMSCSAEFHTSIYHYWFSPCVNVRRISSLVSSHVCQQCEAKKISLVKGATCEDFSWKDS